MWSCLVFASTIDKRLGTKDIKWKSASLMVTSPRPHLLLNWVFFWKIKKMINQRLLILLTCCDKTCLCFLDYSMNQFKMRNTKALVWHSLTNTKWMKERTKQKKIYPTRNEESINTHAWYQSLAVLEHRGVLSLSGTRIETWGIPVSHRVRHLH